MKEMTKIVDNFRQFATEKLKLHQQELNTRYENEAIDKETLEKAHKDHEKILEQELKDNIGKLLSGEDNPWLRNELNSISKDFTKQLSKTHS